VYRRFRNDLPQRAVRLVKRASAALICVAIAQCIPAVLAEQHEAGHPSGLSLSPAVVMLEGKPGQGHRETLRLTNHTAAPMSFQLVAQDVTVAGDERVFLAAGDRPDSIAATAVFSPSTVTIAPGETGTVDMTLTVPERTAVRAVAAIFRGLTEVNDRAHVTMTASLGTLVTFTLSTDVRLDAGEPLVVPQSGTANLRIEEAVSNPGQEPVIASGAVAVLDAQGRLMGRLPVEPHRLLPNERVTLRADYPGWMEAGEYQAIVSLAFGQQLLTRSIHFRVDSPSNGSAPLRRAAGEQ
jgi:hypothetical protein